MNDPRRHGSAAKQVAALSVLAEAAQRAEATDSAVTREELQKAVDGARNVGVGWTKIGDALGIASGNAYQRYRTRPSSEPACDEPPDDEACG